MFRDIIVLNSEFKLLKPNFVLLFNSPLYLLQKNDASAKVFICINLNFQSEVNSLNYICTITNCYKITTSCVKL